MALLNSNHKPSEAIPNPFADPDLGKALTVERPISIMAKPAGPSCNLACKYCYYLEKKHLFMHDTRLNMTDSTLEAYISKYIEAQNGDIVEFVWHGGETTLRDISFYQRAIEQQRIHSRGKKIINSFQTNGTLITDAWAKFLHDNGWLVGISIDGPQRFHDEYRRNTMDKPSFNSVMKGLRTLQRHHVEWNAMAVVNDFNADYPEEFYRFFKNIGCHYIQFTPIVERRKPDGTLAIEPNEESTLTEMSVTPEQWGEFLCRVFDQWVVSDVGSTYVQLFDATLANWVGMKPGLCMMDASCGHAAVMEHNGDVYSCDHFVFPQYHIGNIHTHTIAEMMQGERQRAFSLRKQTLPGQCMACKWRFACNGECPKNRFATTAEGEPGLNHLCEGYRRFFEHAAPFMDYMRSELLAQRPPSGVMRVARELLRQQGR